MPVRALLFDFDGVVADTENHHVAAWQRTLVSMGWEVPDEVCARSTEIDDRAFLAELFERRKIEDGDLDGWVRRKQELTRTMLADSPRIYPGVAALVERVQGAVKVAVVSTTWRENVATVLDAAGLSSAFAVIVGKEDVAAPKPDPEPYRKALKALGVRAPSAWALEDSPNGLASARGAGLRVAAIGHRRPNGPWVGDAPYLPDLRETDRVLDALGIALKT